MKRQIQARAHAHSNSAHERGKVKQCFTRVQDESYARVLEHTPIYDLDTYFQQQKKLKLARFRKNLIQTLTFCCAVLFVSPILFMGG